MKSKEIKIIPPEGYEIDKENSTFECIKFKPKKLTYEGVAKALFNGSLAYYIDPWGSIKSVDLSGADKQCADPNHCVSKKQAGKLLALNKLINVAKYLNGDWEPDFTSSDSDKYFMQLTHKGDIAIIQNTYNNYGTPCFKSVEILEQAIEILGKETIKLALSQI